MKKVFCSKCGKCMTDSKTKSSFIGVHVGIKLEHPFYDKEFYEMQLGKYANERDWRLCWECWLDSLFGV